MYGILTPRVARRTCPSPVSLVCVVWLGLLSIAAALENEHQWPHWRGPLMTGVGPQADPPTEWSESENVRWRTPLPGRGHSTPIVWGARIFVTTAVPTGKPFEPRYDNAPGSHDNLPVTSRQQFVVIAIDRNDGSILWQRVVREAEPHEGGHHTGSLASASPVTDGKLLICSFGSRGIFCLDWDGNVVWTAELGTMHTLHAHGEGSSPVLYQGTTAVNWDHEGDSMTVAWDAGTGRELWRVARDEVTSWSSPIVVVSDEIPQLVVNGTQRIRAYHLNTGTVIWECGGLSSNIVASPVAGHGMVFAGSSYDHQAMLGIRIAGAKGDLSGSDHIVWARTRGTPYVPSPLLAGDWVYYLRHYQGILSRVHARTGEEPLGPFRLGTLRDIYASPVAASGRAYITDRSGATAVLALGERPELLAVNQLRDTFSASAALAGRQIFLRGEQFLYCIEE